MKFLDWFFAARPLLHLPIWSVCLVTLAVRRGEVVWSPNLWFLLAALSCVAAAAYFLNQIHDFKTDLKNNKLGFLQRELISKRGMMIGYVILSVIGLALAAMVSMFILAVVAVQFIIGYLYSAPPAKLKDRPISGLVANALSFGGLVPIVACGLTGTPSDSADLWLAAYFFLAVASTHVLTTLVDVPGDRDVGKKTVAVLAGRTGSLVLAAMLSAVALGVAFVFHYPVLAAIAAVAVVTSLMPIFVTSNRLVLLASKLPLALLTLYAGWISFAYLIFIVAMVFLTRIYYRKRFNMGYPEIA